MNKRSLIRSLIKSCGSAFFSISWVKKSGEERTLTVRDGVESKLALPKGMGSNNQEHCPNLITLFDIQDGRYKSVNLDTVTSVRCGNKVVWKEK